MKIDSPAHNDHLRWHIGQARIGRDAARRLGVFQWDHRTHRRPTGRRVVVVRTWSRDCDMCESQSFVAIPASAAAYNALYAQMEDSAEGPFSATILDHFDLHDLKPSQRDLAAEAWENGRGANAYNVTPED